MGKLILLVNKDGLVKERYHPISPKNRELTEALLQKLIFEEAKLLPTEEIDTDFEHLIPIGREIPVKSGSIDVLYVTLEGKICLVETKLWRNSEAQREVVAQVIDYAKDLSVMSFRDFCESVTDAKGEESEKAFFKKIRENSPDPDEFNEMKFQQDIQESLYHGHFLLLIVGDQIFPKVALMVDSIQSAPHLEFSIELAELKLYRVGEGEDTQWLVVPKVVGKSKKEIRNVIRIIYEEKKPEVKVIPYETGESLLDKESFIRSLDDEGRSVFREILKLYEAHGFPIHYGGKGITLNVTVDGENVHFLEGYGSKAAEGQTLSIYFSDIAKKIRHGEDIVETFRQKLRQTGIFYETKTAMRYKFRKKLTEIQIRGLIEILVELASQIEANGKI